MNKVARAGSAISARAQVFPISGVLLANLAWGIGQPFFSAIAERFGDRRAIITGAFLYAAGLVLSSYAVTPGQMQFLEILVGFGIARFCSAGRCNPAAAQPRRRYRQTLHSPRHQPRRFDVWRRWRLAAS